MRLRRFHGLQSLYKGFIQGFTLIIVPNSSHKKIKSWRISFVLTLIIIGAIVINIYTFIGFTLQVWQIDQLQHNAVRQTIMISELQAEKSRLKPVLEKNNSLESELAVLKQVNLELTDTWKRVQKKGKNKFSIANRDGLPAYNIIPSYKFIPLPANNELVTSLEKIEYNLNQLDHIVNKEITDQKNLLQELQAYERQLDHTPSLWPIHSKIIDMFGMRVHPILRTKRMHEGVDLRAQAGTKIRATADGVVSFAGWEEGYGYLIKIQHEYGYETRYGHNSKLLVISGQKVKKGQTISLSGNTGTSTGPHLHYEVRVNGNPVNPVPFLKD
jgi:murein DD-endopeptidase MepM/ murein hydrolase activator NlpD